MNSLLANTIGVFNGLLALLFVIAGALIGQSQLEDMGLIVGLVVGFILAVVVCGILAIFISMRDELIEIRKLLNKISKQAPSAI